MRSELRVCQERCHLRLSVTQEQHLTGPRFHLRIPSSGLRVMLSPRFPRNHSRWASERGISENHYIRVFSIECPRVNSNYTFLLDCSQPETGEEVSWMADHNTPNVHTCAQTCRLVTSLASEFSLKSRMAILPFGGIHKSHPTPHTPRQ